MRRIAGQIETNTPDAAARLLALADLLVRNDTLLKDWRQRGAPNPVLGRLLAVLTGAPSSSAATRAAPDALHVLDMLKAQIEHEEAAHAAVITLLDACTALLLFTGLVTLAWGARRSFVVRPAVELSSRSDNHVAPKRRDQIDRALD